MNILFFSPYYIPYISGMTTYPRALFAHLTQHHHVTVLTFQYDSELLRQEEQGKIHIARMPYQLKISKGFISFLAPYYFVKYLLGADVIILNIPNAEGVLLAIFAKIFGKKIISLYHCEVDLGNSLYQRCISFFLKLFVTVQLIFSNRIVAYTHSYAAAHIPHFLSHKILYHFPPVEPLSVNETIYQQWLAEKKDSVYIGFAGRLAREKGLEYLIHAIQSVQKQNPDQKYMLLCAGPFGKEVAGEEQYYEDIRKQIDLSGIAVKLLGNLRSGDLGAFYRVIDMLVLPSINQTEAFGMVQVDAIRLGTPLITSHLPGVHEVIDQTKMGILTKPKDSHAIAIAIQKIQDNKATYTNQTLQNQALALFDIVPAVAFWKTLLEDIRT